MGISNKNVGNRLYIMDGSAFYRTIEANILKFAFSRLTLLTELAS